jgi:L-lysine 6-oxidase
MSSLATPRFNPRDNSAANAPLRQAYFALFREPGSDSTIAPSHNVLFSSTGVPMMPLNSGSNSVSNDHVDKFMSLTQAQHFFLKQWAEGKFTTDPSRLEPISVRLTRASTGNCVGNPFCPGIEVTWTTRNPNIYDGPWSIRHRKPSAWYFKRGLDPDRDETEDSDGCEPGDLTKRMANPWQADFFQCSVQDINFTDPKRNTDAEDIPKPPTYYAYWWPPQSPWQVLTGDLTPQEQARAGTPAGQQVLFTRGINEFSEMIRYWSYVGFVVNQATGPYRDLFPYFAEQERAHDKFTATVAVTGTPSDIVNAAQPTFADTWRLKAELMPRPAALAPSVAPAAPTPEPLVGFATSRRRGRLPGQG